MANCKWCEKDCKINQFGYCEKCYAEIRSGIVLHKEALENMASRAHMDLPEHEKGAIMAQAMAAYEALKIYKNRQVPFFKSDIDNLLRQVGTKLTMPRGSVMFSPLEISGRGKKCIILEKNSVKIIRRGSIIATERDKSIPIKQIVGVEVKKPGAVIVGFIQIQTAGQLVSSSSFKYTGGAADAVKDENSVLFSDLDSYHTAMQIKAYIENYEP